MSVKIATRSLSIRKNRSLAYSNILSSDSSNESSAYTRPSDWVALPTITSSDHKFVGLHTVYENSPNFCTVRCTMSSSGTFLIDWGDGTTTTAANNTYQSHSFQYTNTAFNGTISTRGYKQTIITVTPITGNITALYIYNRPNASGTTLAGVSTSKLTRYTTGWLDISLALPYCTTLSFTDVSSTENRLLEQARIYKVSDSMTSYGSLFRHCMAFRSLPVLYHGTSMNNFNYMFEYCFSLTDIPAVLDFTNIGTTNQMFQWCSSLRSVTISLPKVTNADSMFSTCRRLKEVNITNCGAGLTGGNRFNASSMFSSCYSLNSVTMDNANNINYLNSTFANCWNLQTVRISYGIGNLLQTDSTYASCYTIKNVPQLNTSNVFGMNNMHNENYAITFIPSYDTANVTSMEGTFAGCRMMTQAPVLNTSKVTTMNSIFVNCWNLIKDPGYNYSSLTSADSMFRECRNLRTLTLNFPKNLNFNYGCSSCYNLISVTMITGKATMRYLTASFQSCHSLPNENFKWTFTTGTTAQTYTGNIYIQDPTGRGDDQSGWISTDNWFWNIRGMTITISGTSLTNGTTYDGVISGYTNPTTYYIIETDEGSQIRLSTTKGGTPAPGFSNPTGLPTGGLTFVLEGLNIQDMDSMFQYCHSFRTHPTFPAEITSPNAIRRADGMFYECMSINTATDYFMNTANMWYIGSMFRHCYALVRAPALLCNAATDMGYMYESCYALQYIPTYTATNVTSYNNFASSCYDLHKTPTMSLSTVSTNNGAMFGSCYSLVDGSGITNSYASINFDNGNLSGASLDAIYTNLPTTSGKNINVTNNWGSVSSGSSGTWNAPHTPSIATGKGWTVSS